jgi:integrase
LADCVPSIRRWRHAGLPTFLPPQKVQQVLDGCDRTTPMGLRDYAILMVLAKLGLRAGEVVAVTLDDIDWGAGEILVHGKDAARQSCRYVVTSARPSLRTFAKDDPSRRVGICSCACSRRTSVSHPAVPSR